MLPIANTRQLHYTASATDGGSLRSSCHVSCGPAGHCRDTPGPLNPHTACSHSHSHARRRHHHGMQAGRWSRHGRSTPGSRYPVPQPSLGQATSLPRQDRRTHTPTHTAHTHAHTPTHTHRGVLSLLVQPRGARRPLPAVAPSIRRIRSHTPTGLERPLPLSLIPHMQHPHMQ